MKEDRLRFILHPSSFILVLASSWMKLVMNRLEPFTVNMGVDLGCLDAGVAKQFLYGAQVGAAGKEMGRKTVPKRVRANLDGQAGPFSVFLHQHPQCFAGQGFATP